MPDRIARELAFELEQAAHKQHSEAVAAVGKVYKAAKDEAYRQRDVRFNTLRERRAEWLHMHPRTAEIAAEIAIVEDAMRSFRKSPPAPDLAVIEGAPRRLDYRGSNPRSRASVHPRSSARRRVGRAE